MWGPEFTSKDAALQGGVGETAARLNVKLCDLRGGGGGGGILPLILAQSSFESIWNFENNFESTSKEPLSDILTWQIVVE